MNFIRKIFSLPDQSLLQLYKRARILLLLIFALLGVTVSFLSLNSLISAGISFILFLLIAGGEWLSLKTKFNYSVITLPIGILVLFYSSRIHSSEAPFYIFMLMMFVYINVLVPVRAVRIFLLLLSVFVTLLMVHSSMLTDDVFRIGVTYSVTAVTMFILIDYLRKTERELAGKNQDLTDIFNNSPIPVMLIEDSGKIAMINEACTELFGFVKEDLFGKNFSKIFYSESREKTAERLKHLKRSIDENKTLHLQEEYKKKNGEHLIISANTKPIVLHEEKYILFVGLDVTREIRMRNELQHAHKLYRNMASNIPNSVVYMFDKQLRFMLIEGDDIHKGTSHNKKMTGKKLREVFPIRLANMLEDHFNAALLGVESSVEIEFKGKQFVYYFHPVYSDKKEINSGIALSVNISELHQTKNEVATKNKMIDAYAHKASHIVRRPIANLIGLADILLNQENSEEEQKTVLQFIYNSVNELDRSLKDAAEELSLTEKGKLEKKLKDN